MNFNRSDRHTGATLGCALLVAFALAGAVRAQTPPETAADRVASQDLPQLVSLELEPLARESPGNLDPDDQPFVKLDLVDTEVLFDFRRSTLRPAGRNALNGFLTHIRGFDAWLILVVGYMDRLETTAAPPQLAQRRAEAIRKYLVDKGVAPSLIHVQAKPVDEAASKAVACTGPRSAQVIGCLEPDRRVEVEMVGVLAAK